MVESLTGSISFVGKQYRITNKNIFLGLQDFFVIHESYFLQPQKEQYFVSDRRCSLLTDDITMCTCMVDRDYFSVQTYYNIA